MSAFDKQPENNNFLSPLGFRFIVKKLPIVNFYCQSASLPSVSLQETEIPNPLIRIPLAGTKLTYAPLDIRFRVDEDMNNYLEIYNWLHDIVSLGESKIDGTLLILSSHNNTTKEILFRDLFPTTLSALEFSTQQTEIEYLQATASFKYTYFEFK